MKIVQLRVKKANSGSESRQDKPDRSSNAGPEIQDRSGLKLICRNPSFDLLHDGEHARVVVHGLAEGVRPNGRLVVVLREKLNLYMSRLRYNNVLNMNKNPGSIQVAFRISKREQGHYGHGNGCFTI